jgi:peptidoglycan L-alanyl-D-glutamate endopeptidase CwlK
MENEAALSQINPELAARVRRMADALAARGIAIRVSSGLRSTAKQAALYADRANNPNPVARPGTSKHERGEAVDIVPVGARSSGAVAAVGEEGERQGLRWGGRFKTRPDYPHFELPDTVLEHAVRIAKDPDVQISGVGLFIIGLGLILILRS